MATFRHATPGSILASRRVIVSDAITNGNTDFTIQQPANSTLDSCIVRALDTIVTDANATASFRCGLSAAGGVDAIANTVLLGGSADTINAGAVFTAAGAAGAKSNGAAAVVATENRDLYFRIISDQPATAPDNGRLEVTLVFRIFD